jgi:type II secretory pathway component GspD/PulD (secretin)
MNLNREPGMRKISSAAIYVAFTLALVLAAPALRAQSQPADEKPAETRATPETYQTFYLTNLTQQNDANDLQTDLRNIFPRSRIYYVPSQGALSIRASADDLLQMQKLIAELDRPRKNYRITYTLTETENGKPAATQHFTLVVSAGGKTDLKQGSRVPIVTGTTDPGTSTQNSQVQYLDVGISIEASLDGEKLRTKVEQSSLAEEKSGLGAQDPVLHQTTLDASATLPQGKPMILGSLDVPGTTRRQEIQVISELIH